MNQIGMLLVIAWAARVPVWASELVPFVIPLEVSSDSVVTWPANAPITPDAERVTVRHGHFQCGDTAVRMWGVNLSFGANFPSHEDAKKVAARLAASGVNSVRCHQMDTSVWPRGIWDAENPTRLSREALDRLDYFLPWLPSVWLANRLL
jgi:hypothetical protein